MSVLAAELSARLDVHVELLDALVEASQRQQAALLSYRTDREDGAEELEQINHRLRELTAAVGHHAEAVRDHATRLAEERGLPAEAGERLSALADALPSDLGEPIRERASAIRALAGALAELQQLNQLHARRGLQLVSAWWSVLSQGGEQQATYTARGRTRARTSPLTGTLTLNL